MLFVSSIDYILTFFVPMVEAEVKYWLLGQTWPEINDSHAFFFFLFCDNGSSAEEYNNSIFPS